MTAPIALCTTAARAAASAEEVAAALTAARAVASARGAELHWVLLGAASDDVVATARTYGVDAVMVMDHPNLVEGNYDSVVAAVSQYCTASRPALVVVPLDLDNRLICARVAARTGAAVIMNAFAIGVEGGRIEVTSAGFGGDTRSVYGVDDSRTAIVGLIGGVVAPVAADTATEPRVEQVEVDLSGVEERVRVVEPARFEGPRLEEAEIVVAGGRGLGAQENFRLVEELAEVLGGMAAASRPLVDEGWIDSSRQVGLTGKITRPALYLAAGVSGATQHMVGCNASKMIVAINTDPDAAIFRYARYGIVGDAVEVLPELIRVAKERLQK